MPKKFSLIDIIEKYNRLHSSAITNVLQEIINLMVNGSGEVAFLAAKKKLVSNRFLPKDVQDAIDRIVTTFHDDATKVLINGISRAREYSDRKNTLIAKGYFGGGRKPPTKKTQISASSGGRGRKPPVGPENPLGAEFGKHFNPRNLSSRVWKLSNSYKSTLKATVTDGIREGKPAREIAKAIRNSLRNSQGSEKPGQGVYKSPVKNAERLTRSEINMAYEHADYERWQQLWFVIGIEVRLSNRHPKFDICDTLAGKYPKDFFFPGWHPHCLCIAIPVMASEKVRDEMMAYDLGASNKRPTVEYIKAVPAQTTQWLKKNKARISGWKNTPYFISHNEKYAA